MHTDSSKVLNSPGTTGGLSFLYPSSSSLPSSLHTQKARFPSPRDRPGHQGPLEEQRATSIERAAERRAEEEEIISTAVDHLHSTPSSVFFLVFSTIVAQEQETNGSDP